MRFSISNSQKSHENRSVDSQAALRFAKTSVSETSMRRARSPPQNRYMSPQGVAYCLRRFFGLISLTIMSNVPAYPKNPLLHHGVSQSGGDTLREGDRSDPIYSPLIDDIARPTLALRLKNFFDSEPISAVLIVAGLGYIAGMMSRR